MALRQERISVELDARAPGGDSWEWELENLPEAWPYLGPTWVRATERALPQARSWHTLAREDGGFAFLPGFIFTAPPAVDFDPRTYLGWRAATGEEVCCGVQSCDDSSAEVEALGAEAFFPTLVLGSAMGYRSEAAFTSWTPELAHALVEAAVSSALERGVKTISAPWIPDRPANRLLLDALLARGADSAFWGIEDYFPVQAADYGAYLAALPAKRRYRMRQDEERVAAAGVTIERVDGRELRRLVPRVAELTCMNREKNGAGEEPAHIATLFDALLDAGADVRTYLAVKAAEVVGACVTIHKRGRLFIKWAGFDYGALGDRSGVYFPLVLEAPLRDAHRERLQVVECGAGAHEAKALRGCLPRSITTALISAEPEVRNLQPRLLAAFGERRREAFAVGRSARPRLPVISNGACCDGG